MEKNKQEQESCENMLSQADMFQKVPPNLISTLASRMKPRVLKSNEVLLHQGDPSDRFFLVESGDIKRTYIDPADERPHTIEYSMKAQSINSMRILSGESVYATVKCTDECKVYEMARKDFFELIVKNPEISVKIAEGLCEELRKGSKKFQTPLLEQKQEEVNIPAVSIGAGIESYYRSALNAMLNARLTGVKAEFFPNMHIQVPTRVVYICGFKWLRSFFDRHVDPEPYSNPTAVRLATAIAPGVIMTPVSSVLEASNAGHMNSEPMTTRWMRGAIPRCGREIIFGVGLNQLSDYFEERMQPYFPENKMMANAAGSLAAGTISGYLSHVPHNISTFKLMQPHRSYGDLYRMFVDKSTPRAIDRMVASWPPTAQTVTRSMFATLFPKGCFIRTNQIVGSFMILNGTINYLQLREHNIIQRALGM